MPAKELYYCSHCQDSEEKLIQLICNENGTFECPHCQMKGTYDLELRKNISLLKERQETGVKVTVVTWHPDCYKYGKSEVRMELLEQLRNTGFDIQLMEEACEHFAVVDQKAE